MQKKGYLLRNTAYKALKNVGVFWENANKTYNMKYIHKDYKVSIPSVKYKQEIYGVTDLIFCRWKKTIQKNQKETPYTEEGRKLYEKRTGKTKALLRDDEMLELHKEETLKKECGNTISILSK